MCAILDNNVRHEVFGDNPTEAGTFFLDWLTRRGGVLVVGGKLLMELGESLKFAQWLRQAERVGRARSIPDQQVNDQTERLQRKEICQSDDQHVLALALVSGARLLFTNDRALQDDFRDRRIVPGVRGRVFTTLQTKETTTTHKRLLRRTDLCNK